MDEQTRKARNANDVQLFFLWLRWTFYLCTILILSALGAILQRIADRRRLKTLRK